MGETAPNVTLAQRGGWSGANASISNPEQETLCNGIMEGIRNVLGWKKAISRRIVAPVFGKTVIVMRLLCLLLTSVVLAAAQAAPPANHHPDEISAPQQRMVGAVLTRLNRANRLASNPEELVAPPQQYAALLRRVTHGRAVSQAELRELLQETDRREKAAIERLARRFRVEVYRTFRQQRGVFTRRRAAWHRVETQWKAAGARFEEQDRLLEWLELAIQSSLPDTIGPLPEDPAFDPALQPETETQRPPAIVRNEPSQSIEEPIPAPAALKTSQPVVSLPVPGANLTVRNRDAAGPDNPPQPGIEVVDAPRVGTLPVRSVAPRNVADRRLPSADLTGGRPLPAPTRPPAMEDPSADPVLPEPPAAADAADASDEAAPPPSYEAVEFVAWLPQPDEVAPAASRVEVNLDELTARIAGANLALRALEAELEKSWTFNGRRLGPLVDRLSTLAARHSDLAVFRQLISAGQRSLVGRLESPRAAISQMAARVYEARTHANAPDFRATPTEREAELRYLDEISRQLARLAAE